MSPQPLDDKKSGSKQASLNPQHNRFQVKRLVKRIVTIFKVGSGKGKIDRLCNGYLCLL
jgi:hypothetical protein